MPRGKNYCNNNRGVFLQTGSHKSSYPQMKLCEYGIGCNRADCIYRHDTGSNGKAEEVCLPFLAGKCTFSESGCRRRHPKKPECDRLIAKYKRTRCRFGDECRTSGCLYLHPAEMKEIEPSYIEPHHIAFPPLNAPTSTMTTSPSPTNVQMNSVWQAAPAIPAVTPTMLQASAVDAPEWHPSPPPPQEPFPPSFYGPGNVTYEIPHMDPTNPGDMMYDGANGYYVSVPHYQQPQNDIPLSPTKPFNVNAKEFVPSKLTP